MSSLYANTGCDLDLILYKGTGPGAVYIYDDTGSDIGQKYAKGTTGYNLGFKVADGTDVGRILGGDVVAIWRSSHCTSSSSADDAIADAWHNVTMFSSDKSKWTKIEQDVESYHIGTHFHGTSLWRHNAGYGAYAYHLMLNIVGAEAEITLGSPSSSDGKVWLTEIKSPNSYTKNFVIAGLGGTNASKKYVETYGDDGSYSSRWEYTAIYSSIQLKIAIKSGGSVTREYYAKLSF